MSGITRCLKLPDVWGLQMVNVLVHRQTSPLCPAFRPRQPRSPVSRKSVARNALQVNNPLGLSSASACRGLVLERSDHPMYPRLRSRLSSSSSSCAESAPSDGSVPAQPSSRQIVIGRVAQSGVSRSESTSPSIFSGTGIHHHPSSPPIIITKTEPPMRWLRFTD